MIGEDLIMVLVVVVEGGGRGDDEDVTHADHAHIGRDAVTERPIRGPKSGSGSGSRSASACGIEAEAEIVASAV